MVGLSTVTCCLKQPLTRYDKYNHNNNHNLLVWGIHLSLTVKHLQKASCAGALVQSHHLIDPLRRGFQNPALVFLN